MLAYKLDGVSYQVMVRTQQVPNISITVVVPLVLYFHQSSPGIWMGAWNILGLPKGEVRGGGDKSIRKNFFCVHNDLSPGKGWRTKQWPFLQVTHV